MPQPHTTASAITPSEVEQIITDVEKVVEDVAGNSQSLPGDAVALVGAVVTVLVALTVVTSTTSQIILAGAGVGIPAIWRIIAAWKHSTKAKTKAALVTAAATLRASHKRA